MGDDRLRELEQRWRATGALDDEARWHAARLRAGRLDPQLLPVAAWAGSAAAGLLLGVTPPAPPRDPGRGWSWVCDWLAEGLTRAPLAARRRAALAELERLLLYFEGVDADSRQERAWGLAARALLRGVADDLSVALLRGEPAAEVPGRDGEVAGVGPSPAGVSRTWALAWRAAKRVCKAACEPERTVVTP